MVFLYSAKSLGYTPKYLKNVEDLHNFICPFYENVKNYKIHATRHLKYSYISIFTNLTRTDNETKCVKPIYNHIS